MSVYFDPLCAAAAGDYGMMSKETGQREPGMDNLLWPAFSKFGGIFHGRLSDFGREGE